MEECTGENEKELRISTSIASVVPGMLMMMTYLSSFLLGAPPGAGWKPCRDPEDSVKIVVLHGITS